MARAAMRDFIRDWRKWSRAERATAVVIAAMLMIAVPMALVATLSIAGPIHQTVLA